VPLPFETPAKVCDNLALANVGGSRAFSNVCDNDPEANVGIVDLGRAEAAGFFWDVVERTSEKCARDLCTSRLVRARSRL
jgi:hypothetical protein